jgi:hypothetical protein
MPSLDDELELELLKMANGVLGGKAETLGDFIDPTKQAIKSLYQSHLNAELGKARIDELQKLYDRFGHSEKSEAIVAVEVRLKRLKEPNNEPKS